MTTNFPTAPIALDGRTEVPWDFTTGDSVALGEGVQLDTTENFRWAVVLGGLLAFFMAWGIGANDVANAFATSVGAGAISLKWACVIAAVFEFLGALLLGSEVTDTVRKKIVDPNVFNPVKSDGALNGPEIFMVGSVIVLLTAGLWLLVATYFEMPVSTTHSIIGSYIGFGFAFRGAGAVIWLSSGTGLSRLKGVVGVIASWIISPVLSGILAVLVFLIVRTTVLRTKNPVRSAFLFAPIFYALTIIITVFFVIYKGDKRAGLKDELGLGGSFGVAFGAGAVVALLSWYLLVPPQKRYIDRWEARRIEEMKTGVAEVKDDKLGVLKKVGINVDYDDTLDDRVQAIHDAAEVFEPKAEQAFAWMQVFTASFDAFSHGANDVANAIAPFATIFSLYESGGNLSEAKGISEADADGTYEGGPVGGESFEEGDDVLFGGVCAEQDGDSFKAVQFFSCKTNGRFPFLQQAPANAESRSDLFAYVLDEETNVATWTSSQTCFSECNPGSYPTFGSIKQEVPLWILALGGAGIVAGLAMWGYRIILAIGSKLTKITPSRGFSIELGAAITVLIASKLGLPVSTTHCQVGATVGVGLVEGKASTVNWRQLGIVFFGWVATVVLTAFTSFLLILFVISAPSKYDVDELDYCPGEQLMVYDGTTARGVLCSGLRGVDGGASEEWDDLVADILEE
eukprot:CAMPEP_0198312250 /NCGR_PEP_ID=MMETSP1450-20131203/3686_1 /TAXON_ID=753684 ORGANISM="Madagascaria erythrocladiodes, Strain CCMP3234" /NCGR_SAMPLE_ID=MMETSP1450 /ASSEMBLY_ACC=CAM_ASM_001115 /LENGTH=683 /DNA_ID=CAMNT_0044015189 /DNA_START=59 /DNA_END=2110 /DNA_ORIENTATION=+